MDAFKPRIGFAACEVICSDDDAFIWAFVFDTPQQAMFDVEEYLYDALQCEDSNDFSTWYEWTGWQGSSGRIVYEMYFEDAERKYVVSSIHHR
jgi:hypothetical protein